MEILKTEHSIDGKLPDDIASAVEVKFEPNPDGSATVTYATSTYERAAVKYDFAGNIVNITRYITGDKGHQDPAGQRNTTGDEDMNTQVNRGRILLKAREIINGERQDQYGNPEDCFELIGKLWTIYMTNKQRQAGALLGFIGKKDVAIMMVLFKLAREMNGAGKEDNLIDAAGYLGIAGDMR